MVIDLRSANGNDRAITTPIVVVEILSAGAGYDDHLEKFEAYRVLDSLLQYVVLEQGEPKVCVRHRGENGWPDEPDVLEGPEALLTFPRIGAEITPSEVYRTSGPRDGCSV